MFNFKSNIFKVINDKIESIKEVLQITTVDSLEEIGDYLVKEASRRAPVDTGELESSIKWEIIKENKKYTLRVYVDGDSKAIDYSWYVHELFPPAVFGLYKLGEESLKKQAREGVIVGGHFLTRAYDENKEEVTKRFKKSVKASIEYGFGKGRRDR